jgi:CRISPR-associated protein Cas1
VANLYITEQNSILRKTGDRLLVHKDDEVLLDVQCHKIDAVLIFGNVQFTTQAVHELFEHGIEMAILSRRGKLKGQITSPVTKNIYLRIKQFEKYNDEAFKLKLSKQIVAAKIANCLQLTRSFSYNHPELELAPYLDRLKTYLIKVEKTDQIDQLLGIEGGAAKAYFKAFGNMVLGGFNFPGRVKRPPTDPVNAILSFSYTMVFNEISSLLDGLGFDPYLGYLHKAEYGRPSLAADLIEEFRSPVADRLTLKLINNRVFQPEDFYTNPKGGGVYLKRKCMKRYFVEYEKKINSEFEHPHTGKTTTLRKCFRIQAERLAATIQNKAEYVPHTMNI